MLYARARFGQHRDDLAAALRDLLVDGLLEARLLHRRHFHQLAPARRKRADLQGFRARDRAGRIAHDESKARDQLGVQPVGLGALALGGAPSLDAARIDHGDVEIGARQRPHQSARIGADRFEHDAPHAGALEPIDDDVDAFGDVRRPKAAPARRQCDIEKVAPDIDAGRTDGCCHGSAPVCGLARPARRPSDCPVRQKAAVRSPEHGLSQGPFALRPLNDQPRGQSLNPTYRVPGSSLRDAPE
jgi:hypothetical protein